MGGRTLELVLGTEPPARVARGTVHFVTQIATVPVSVTAEVGRDTVARGTLEGAVLE